MKCPYCGYKESKVVDSRPADDESIRRRRECLCCERRFTTYETVEYIPMVVIKRDGTRQSFDRGKVLTSMMRACEKRTVPLARLEELADEIERSLQNSTDNEITTDMVGQQVMEKLRGVDEVAYVRFVSVYRQFKDIDTFLQELTKLQGETKIK
ncbi:MAG: transcriptional repressor NrdR [Oscillospiraceae bacterium]|nr:transcriptional repressor NrdR [Oscillospiraceae bacterium]